MPENTLYVIKTMASMRQILQVNIALHQFASFLCSVFSLLIIGLKCYSEKQLDRKQDTLYYPLKEGNLSTSRMISSLVP